MCVKQWACVLAMGLVVGACLPREGASGIDLEAPARATKGLGLYHTVVIEHPANVPFFNGYSLFPAQVAMHGATLLVRAHHPSSIQELDDILVYELTAENAIEVLRIESVSRGFPDWGNKVAVHGDHAVFVDGATVRWLQRVAGNWTSVESALESPHDSLDPDPGWATSLAMDVDRLVVGAPGEIAVDGGSELSGAVYVFPFDESGVGAPTLIAAPAPTFGQRFGAATWLHDSELIVMSVPLSVPGGGELDIVAFDDGGVESEWSSPFHGAIRLNMPWHFVATEDMVLARCKSCTENPIADGVNVVRREESGAWTHTVVGAADLGFHYIDSLAIVDQQVIAVLGTHVGVAIRDLAFFDIAIEPPSELARLDATGFEYGVAVFGHHIVQGGHQKLRVSRLDFTLGSPCDDDSSCTQGFCRDGVCCDSACGDGDLTDCLACSVAVGAAVDGVCAPTTGSACDDGDGCTLSDTCVEGACTGVVVLCEDQNPCTVDACADDACEHVNVDDETRCPGGSCFDGKCVPTTTDAGDEALDAGAAPSDSGPVTPPTCTCGTSSSSSPNQPVWLAGLIALAVMKKRRQPSALCIHDGRAIDAKKEHA